MRSRKIFQKQSEVTDAKRTQIEETKNTIESQLIGSLGFTSHFLTLASDEYANFLNQDKLDIAILSVEKAKLEAKLNLINAKLDHMISVAKIKSSQQRQKEWRELVAAERARKLEKEIEKARERNAKALKGIEKKVYKQTGELPHERLKRIMDEFQTFLDSQK